MTLETEGGANPRRPTFSSAQIVVYDDFLPPKAFGDLFAMCNAADYEIVHQSKWRKVWRLHDGLPLQGKTVMYYPDRTPPRGQLAVYPTGTTLDLFVEAIEDMLPAVAPVIGTPNKEWACMSAAPWVYPTGSGLSLHQDGDRYSGAYTYFVHPEWNVHWGGWLLVLDPATAPATAQAAPPCRAVFPPWLDDSEENARVWSPGVGTCILPKPNRIVFISPGARHLVSRVDANAGMKPRVSVAGFFIKERL